jgi:hypothetical protein
MKYLYSLLLAVVLLNPAFAQKVQLISGYTWSNTIWQPSFIQTYTYDNDDFVVNITSQTWNSTSSAWVNSATFSYTNDANGNGLQTLVQIWNSSANSWTNSSLQSTTYTPSNKVLAIESRGWSGTTWTLSTIYNATYDNNGFLISVLYQSWNATTQSMQNSLLVTYTNNANGDATQTINQYWVASASTWTNSSKLTYTYNGSNKMINSNNESWTSTGWQTSTQSTYSLDPNGYLVNQLTQSWNTSSSTFVNYTQVTHTNTAAGQVLESVYQSWISNAWTNSYKYVYTYQYFKPKVNTISVNNVSITTASCSGDALTDGGATITTRGICYSTTQNPNTANLTANAGTGTGTFTANLSGLAPLTVYYARAFATNSVGTRYGAEVSFSTAAQPPPPPPVDETAIGENQMSGFHLFPVPANVQVIVYMPAAQNVETYSIYNLTGKLVLSGKLQQGENLIRISELPAGIYNLRAGPASRTMIVSH